MGNVHMIVG